MPLLIDGYNLLHATGIVGRGSGPGGLERSRLALLNFLAASLRPEEAARTTVVFDAHEAPWGLPRAVEHHGITVHFASKHESADALIVELIGADSAPRRLTVVSSDHEIQRAARRRRAKAVDSDAWYAELLRTRRQRAESSPSVPERPAVPLLAEDVEYWIRQFGFGDCPNFRINENGTVPLSDANNEKPASDDTASLDNPFPPGYGEDLMREL